MKIKACKVSWSSVCAANCRAKKWRSLRLPGHLLLKFGVWEMAAMSSIGCFHTLPLSTLISVSEAEERNISPRLMSDLRLATNTNGSIHWLARSCRVTGQTPPPPPLRRTETNPSGRTTYWYCMYVLAGSLVLIHISAAACPAGGGQS